MNSAIILAGGSGSRIEGETPKQFLKINRKDILSYSVKTFLNHPKVNEVIIVGHPDWIDKITEDYQQCKVVQGGKRRQDSSLNGVRGSNDKSENILIHDAARPFISHQIISACLEALNNCNGSAPVMRASNSLIQLDKGKASYIDRSTIYEVQTPQCFKKKLIGDILSTDVEGTDEIGMVLQLFPHKKLEFIAGEEMNKKITTIEDLNYFAKLFK